ncbi:MAG: alkaline shock response membrane anchor protein AmaP, partial [Coriobacteriales bacterium]|nr:alkaline shock response membrane anchor protein AmaP [Coriobacteriales bacterium]
MNWFKRLCLFLFGLCGLASLATLALTWVGPWTPQFRSYLEIPWFFYTLEVMVLVAAAGLLICVLYALFKPRNPKETIIATLPGGQISVRRSAIISQTRHVIEADGSCVATSVKVRMHRRGRVRVRAIVTPRYPINVAERSITLHEELEQGLAQICADGVRSIVLVFREPQQLEMPQEDGEVETYIDEEGQEVRVIVPSGTKVISNKRAAE